MSDKGDWLAYYDAQSNAKLHAPEPERPEWSRADCVAAGRRLAQRFVTEPAFAELYLDIVKSYKVDGGDHSSEYKTVIVSEYSGKEAQPFNAHDFANVHRAAWLWLLEAFARLVDHNPHRKGNVGDWGNPDPGDITNGRDPETRDVDADADADPNMHIFHNVPNATGYYAISTSDIAPPTVTN